MKTVYRYILRSYIPPFIVTLIIAIFILFMQWLWKYVDDLIGKGLEWTVIAKLFFWASLLVVPWALPLAILMSAVMTFGNMGESYELVSLKASGMSLQRIMRPLIVLAFLLAVAGFFFLNNVLPYANLKGGSLIYDVQQKKPELNLKEGVFNNEIDGYVIKINSKNPVTGILHGITIYDHTANRGNNKVIFADSGSMAMSRDGMFLLLNLYRGSSFEEMVNSTDARYYPLMRSRFERQAVRIDLSSFKFRKTDESLFKSNYEMLNLSQIDDFIDSLKQQRVKRIENFSKAVSEQRSFIPPRSVPPGQQPGKVEPHLRHFSQADAIELALNNARNRKQMIESAMQDIKWMEEPINKLKVQWHKKLSMALACLVMFFVGAPLGAIIRKGGLGMPVVVSAVFFLVFYVISIIGEKAADSMTIPPYIGLWIPHMVLIPISIILTRKATADSALFNIDIYTRPFRRLLRLDKISAET